MADDLYRLPAEHDLDCRRRRDDLLRAVRAGIRVRCSRDAKITQIYEGTDQIQRVVMSRQLLGKW